MGPDGWPTTRFTTGVRPVVNNKQHFETEHVLVATCSVVGCFVANRLAERQIY